MTYIHRGGGSSNHTDESNSNIGAGVNGERFGTGYDQTA